MDVNANRHATNIGSGRSRLPQVPLFEGVNLGPGLAQADLPTDDDEGTVRYCSDLAQLVLFNGTDWVNPDGTALA